MFYIVSGEARLVRMSLSGMEIVFQRSRLGFLAEASLDQPAYHCDGIAAANTRALAIPLARFRAELSRDVVRDHWLRHMSHELRRVRAQNERLTLRSASDRIHHYIETEGRDGQIALAQSKKSWAAELGLTHEALYRTLRAMQNAGSLQLSGEHIRLRIAQKP